MPDAKKTPQKASNFWERFADAQSRVAVRRDKSGVHGAKYRDLNSILDVVKPALAQHKLFLIFKEEVCSFTEGATANDIKTTATVSDGENVVEAYGFTTIDTSLKGSRGQQVGAAVTYARRYAIEGLFAICETPCFDDVDADGPKPKPTAKTKPASKPAAKVKVVEKKEPVKVKVVEKKEPVKVTEGQLESAKKAIRDLANDCDIPYKDILEFIGEEFGVLEWSDVETYKELSNIYLAVKGYCDRAQEIA